MLEELKRNLKYTISKDKNKTLYTFETDTYLMAKDCLNGRGKNKTNNVDNCIMLCDNCHDNVVHKNQKKYRPILNEMIRNGSDRKWKQ